jgi:glutamine amidotransferase
MIAIVNYGMGNLRSVQKALEHLGAMTHITSDPADLHAANAVVLPGVGAFGAAMQRLNDAGLTPALRRAIEAGKPFLGICLGLQLLFESSSESPGVAGLGVLKGRVVGFAETPDFPLRVPHMGWSRLRLAQPDCPLWQGIPDGAYVYFVHSYYAVPEGDQVCPPSKAPRFARGTMQGVRFPLLAGGTLRRGFSLSLPTRFPCGHAPPGGEFFTYHRYCEYGVRFACAVGVGNLYAVQFHPEKSSDTGLQILRNFLACVGAAP